MCPTAPCAAPQLCSHQAWDVPRTCVSLTRDRFIGVRSSYMTDVSATENDELSYEGGGLPKTGNWWSAFVIGLAGTILVTGIAPTMVTSLGAAAIPITFLATAQRLAAVPVPGGARGDDARPLGRFAHLRLRRLQGPLSEVRRPPKRDHRVGLLARLVPGGATKHDPGVVLHREPVQPEHHERDLAARDEHRLVDDRRSRSSGSCCCSSPPTGACGSARSSRRRSLCCR